MDEEGWQSPDIPPPCNGVRQIKKRTENGTFFFYAKYENGKWGWGWDSIEKAKINRFTRRDTFNFVWRGKQKDD